MLITDNFLSTKTHLAEFEDYFKFSSLKFSDNVFINRDFLFFLYFLKKKKYKIIANFMERELILKTKAFYTEVMYIKLYKLIQAFLIVKKLYRLKISKKTKKNLVYVNKNSLELSDLDDHALYINNNNNIFGFNSLCLVKLLRYNIKDIDEFFYLNQKLPLLKNPYTNIEFTLKEKLLIYENIKRYYFRKKRVMPTYLIHYKNSYFNHKIYRESYFKNLLYTSIGSYLEHLNKDNFKTEFLGMIHSNYLIEKRYCKRCFQKIDIKKEFLGVVRIYILNSNSIYKFGYYLQTFKTICYNLNINITNKHSLIHRRRFKIRNRGFRRVSPDINMHPFASQ